MSVSIVQQFHGELTVSSEIVAERTENEHASVLRLVRNNQTALEEFGDLRFEILDRPGVPGPPQQVAHLNEQQATLLITFMRNSPVVVEFKVELVKQFYAMRQALVKPQGAELLALAVLEAQTMIAAKDERIAALEPRAAVADAFEQDHGMKLRPFIQKYFPDEKESAVLDFLYHVKRFLIHDPQGRWSDVQKKRIPGPTHQHPRAHGREFFHLAEEEDRNGKIRLKLRVRRDREHHLVGYLARHGFKTTHDALPMFELGDAA